MELVLSIPAFLKIVFYATAIFFPLTIYMAVGACVRLLACMCLGRGGLGSWFRDAVPGGWGKRVLGWGYG